MEEAEKEEAGMPKSRLCPSFNALFAAAAAHVPQAKSGECIC